MKFHWFTKYGSSKPLTSLCQEYSKFTEKTNKTLGMILCNVLHTSIEDEDVNIIRSHIAQSKGKQN